MKAILGAAAFFAVSAAYAQNISSYKTIFLSPPEGKSQKYVEQYGLYKVLAKTLKSKGYQIVTEKPAQSDAAYCDTAFGSITDTSSFLKNKVRVDMKDCQGKSLYSMEGKSDEKEYEVGYPDALARAVQNLPPADPNAKVAVYQVLHDETAVQNQGAAKNSPIDDEKLKNNRGHEIQPKSKVSDFSYNNQSLKKINLSASQFILVNGNSSTPYATFKESGRSGVYHVTLENGTQTLGYIDGGKIIVEVPNGDGYRKMELNAN